jgi:hypothetical protein
VSRSAQRADLDTGGFSLKLQTSPDTAASVFLACWHARHFRTAAPKIKTVKAAIRCSFRVADNATGAGGTLPINAVCQAFATAGHFHE